MINIFKKINKIRKRRLFKKNAEIQGQCIFTELSGCVNKTGNKSNIQIGFNCAIHGAIIAQGNGYISIGDYSYIGGHTQIGSTKSVNIGKYAIISNYVRIHDNNNHPTSPNERMKMSKSGFFNEEWSNLKSESKPIIIKDNVWICEFVSILKGVTVGEGSIVSSHSVVTKDVPPYTIVAGNPAKVVKQLERLDGNGDIS